MGELIEFLLFLIMCISGVTSMSAVRYNPRSNYHQIEIVKSELNTVSKVLDFLKDELREEKEKSACDLTVVVPSIAVLLSFSLKPCASIVSVVIAVR